MITIAVVDDEKYIREEIEQFIRQKRPDCRIDCYETGEELLSSRKEYDIVFLDIQLEGKNGIDVARMLRQEAERAVLIFVTGAKDYVFQAFDVAAFHYLLKPLEKEKFEEVLERAFGEVKKQKKKEIKPLLVKTKTRVVSVPVESILYVESRGKKAEIHTIKEVLVIYASLNGLEAELGTGFYRSHRGYLVNMTYVSEYYHDSILLTNGERIYLAKDKYQEFVKTYMRWLKDGGD